MNIRKIYIEFDDPAGGLMQYQAEALTNTGLQTIDLPFGLNTFDTNYFKLELYEKDAAQPAVIEGLERLKYLALGAAAVTETPVLRDWKRRNETLSELLPEHFKERHENFPTLEMHDVTECDMFGYEKIPKSRLGSKGGIWAWHGLRKLEFSVDDLGFDEENKAADERQLVGLYFYKLEREELENVIEVEDIRFNLKKKVYVAYLNTNRFGEELKHVDDTQPIFYGRFEVHLYNRKFKSVYSFPVELCVHDTRLDEKNYNHLLDAHGTVSIDFGTSSTCAAVKGSGGPELITLSGEGKLNGNGDDPYDSFNSNTVDQYELLTSDNLSFAAPLKRKNNRYENPTNLMIYDWDEFYRQWEQGNKNRPFLVTKNKDLSDAEADFDSGYSVDEILKDINADARGQRRVRATITELKTIPEMSKEKRHQIKIKPLNDVSGKIVYVTDNFENENEYTLDPIAFYGYLLSCAINNPIRQKIYRRYKITFPVKFPKEVRDKICASLAYGIRRALPLPVAETKVNNEPFISVSMEYEEPVACLGAIVANQLIISDESPEAKLFAIFDLGGGTLDTSYGIFREARDAEYDYADYTIQIFGCGGNERVGGEKLIHQLAYQIYLDNRELMESNKIPFVLPVGERFPQGFEGLLSEVGDEISNANVSMMKENIARTLFQRDNVIDGQMTEIFGADIAPDATHCKITLRNKADVMIHDLSLEIDHIDDFLQSKIQDLVDDFKAEMDNICSTEKIKAALNAAGIDDYRPQDFTVFLGGNASKQQYLAPAMRRIFPEDRIKRIENADTSFDENLNDCFKLNGKTAVAFGQLNLESYFVDRSAYQTSEDGGGAPFAFYVGYVDAGSGNFKPILNANDNSREFKRANRVRNNLTNLSYTTDPQFDRNALTPLNKQVIVDDDTHGRWLWIRVAPDAHNCIEYRIGDATANFSANEPMDKNKILQIP